jgi:hemin uptake protein HemP
MTSLKRTAPGHPPPLRTTALTPGAGVSSELLLGTGNELKIRHNGETYSLRKTRLGKLILTK